MQKKTFTVSLLLLLFVGFVGFVVLTNISKAATTVTLSSTAQTETTVSLSWTESQDVFFSSYTLYFSSAGVNGPYSDIWSTTVKGQTTTYVNGLSPNTNYWFYIVDSGVFVGSSSSNTLQVATAPNPYLEITSQTMTTVSLLWYDYNTYSSQVPFDSYTLQMSTFGGPWSTITTITDPSQNTYVITGLSPGLYYVRMCDSVGTSGNIQTSYSNSCAVDIIEVSISPTSATLDVNQAQTFTSTVSGGMSPYTYQWYLNGAAVSGATSSSWTWMPSSAGSYTIYLNATDSAGYVAKSNVASLTINPALTCSITPTSVTMDVGQSKTFTVSASGGTTPYSYQWYLDGSGVSGATSPSWTYSPSSSGSHSVYVKVTDSASTPNTVQPSSASVTVNSALSISISPSSVTLNVGQSQTFTSNVSGGTSPYVYQWYENGAAVPGATSSTWTFTPSSTGSYSVYVNITDNAGFSAKSNTTSVSVNSPSTPLSGLFPLILYVLVAIIAVVVATVVLVRRKKQI
jgi:hypothetical protein